jgi:protein gp37
MMADGTKIEWTDATWNPITGCQIVSAGCKNCYAMRIAGTRLRNHPTRTGLTRQNATGKPVWNGEVRFNKAALLEPLKWTRPRKIFVCAHADLFYEAVPDEWINSVFAIMALTPQHTYQVLTKRPERMREYMRSDGLIDRLIEAACKIDSARGASWATDVYLKLIDGLPLPNVWLGTSVEDQATAEERIPILLDTPAALRWISAEPLLGSVDLEPWLPWPDPTLGDDPAEVNGKSWGCQECDSTCRDCPTSRAVYQCDEGPIGEDGCPTWVACERVTLDWIVVGGESGAGARPMHPSWARSIRDQCAAATVPFLFKQWGAWGHARPEPAGTPGHYAIASAGPHSDSWPQAVTPVAYYPRPIDLFGGATVLKAIGKKIAGRLLDGVEHNGFPEAWP